MLASSSPPAPGEAGIARGYAPLPGIEDEMMSATGEVRPHWRTFLEGLERLGRGEMERRWANARLLIHENGVSYNVYGDPQGMERPWSLAPVPVVLDAATWAQVSAGLAQRARLLDLVLRDLYGPQRALSEGWLPPDLVYAHPSFLRACHDLPVPRGRWLPFYGADFVRAPDGRFVALADRTQAPSGAGYALENRIVVSRALPELFRACNVERLALFFRTLQDSLRELAPHNRDNPRVVLLTPGPYNATYFEQAYLAQYLGYTLVNGGDLTVRDDRVFLKTLSGLEAVDVILRRVNDDYCDPLELRSESVLGVPGLVQAARQGNVALGNPLGTGLLQTAALQPYLSRLARGFLGEDLLMPSVRTWWCGDPASLSEVLARLPTLVMKPTFPESYTHPVFASKLTADEQAALAARIRAQPREWVAQEEVAAATTPTLAGDRLEPRALVLRSYAVATRERYVVMPGALARVAGSAGNPEISMQMGAGSQDTWVLAEGAVSSFSLLPPPSQVVELSRGGGDLPSRTADNLYWLGRYAERAEGIARLSRVVASRLQDAAGQADLEGGSSLSALFRALAAQTDLTYAPAVPVEVGSTLARAEAWLRAAVMDGERAGSLAAVVRAALRVARTVRDRLSADTWRVLASLDDDLRALTEDIVTSDLLGALGHGLNRTVLGLAAFQGLAMESMTRGQAWRFVDMGRRLERAMTLVLLLRTTLTTESDPEGPLLEAVLDAADSGMTYRRRYPANLQVAPVVDLLLTDETNPRAVVYQLRALADHLEALPPIASGALRRPQTRLAQAALAELQLADVLELCKTDEDGHRPGLDLLLERLGERIPALSDALSSSYLSHAAVSRHLGADGPRSRGDAP